MLYTTEILLFFSTVLLTVYVWMKYQYSYWKRKNIPYIPPTFFVGNLFDLLKFSKSPAELFTELYNHKNAVNESVVGMYVFHSPALLVRDPEICKMMLVKDFNKFSNRYSASDPHTDSLGGYNLFFLKNPIWKQMRTKLTPVFTSGKMKQMFTLVDEIGKKLDNYLTSLPIDSKTNSACIELKEMCALYTTDVIASTAYGIEANSLKNPEGEFRRNGKNVFKFTMYRALEFAALFFMPRLVPIFKLKVFSKESDHFIRSTLQYVMNEREKSGTTRNDVIDTLIALKRASKASTDQNELVFDGDLLVAQAAIFFTAGFETSSSAMSFGLYELAKKPECQERLRQEIKEALMENNGEITYETILNLKYLNMVLQEVLRMYPPLPFLDRECTLAANEDGYSLEPFSKYSIPNGMPIYFPIYAIQRDPKYFPDPDTFNPERFAPENKDNILPYTYMPFGVGPHNCIGERFGLLQAKVGLVNFFKNHTVRLSPKSHKVMKLDKKALIIQSEGGIYCDIVRSPLIN